MTTTRSASRKGSGRSITASTTVKIAELAPTPRAIVRTAIAVNPGCLRSARKASRNSRNIRIQSNLENVSPEIEQTQQRYFLQQFTAKNGPIWPDYVPK